MTRFSNDTVQIQDTGDSLLTLRALSSVRHSLGISTNGPDTGNLEREAIYVTSRSEEIAFESTALESLINIISLLSGKCVLYNSGAPNEVGLKIFGQGHDPCGTNGRTSGSTNMQKTVQDSHVLITGISGSVGQDCVASVRGICLSLDGTTAPSATVYNVALPSSPVVDDVFTIAEPDIGGTTLAPDGVISVNLETNIDVRVIQGAGFLFPTAVLILKCTPTIRVVTEDISTIEAAVGEDGLACALADSKLRYQKRESDGGLIAAASSEHIEIQYEGFAYINDAYNANGRNVGTMEVVIECTEPSSGVCLTPTLNTALT